MDKKYIIGIIVLVIIIVGAMFLVNNKINGDNDVNGTESLLVSENGVSIIVPADWVKASSQSNESILAVADPDSKDASGFNSININIEKKNLTGSLANEFDSNYKTLSYDSNYEILFTGNVSFGNQVGMEAEYTSNVGNITKQHKAIWLEKDDYVYVILCSAPQSSFAEQEVKFNSIISTFKFT